MSFLRGLFGPPDVDKLKAKGNVRGLVNALGSDDASIRRGAAQALGELRSAEAVELLIAALGDEDRDVRSSAAAALGKIGDEQAVESLIAALGDEDYSVRRDSAEALGRIGDARAVEPIVAALIDRAGSVNPTATAKALAEIGDARAIQLLVEIIVQGDRREQMAAVEVLERLGWRPDTSKAGATYWVVKREWENCVNIGATAVEPLMTALSDDDKTVRGAASKALAAIREPSVEPLMAALKDEDLRVRDAAADVLGEIGDARAVEPLIVALGDEGRAVRFGAARALGKIGDVRAVEPIVGVLSGMSVAFPKVAAEALAEIGGTRAIPLLVETMVGGDRRAQKGAAEVLDRLGWRPDDGKAGATYWVVKRQWENCVKIGVAAIEPLATALTDSSERVREAASKALVEIGEPAFEMLVAVLKHEDPNARKAAADALGGIGDARAVEPLVAVLNDGDSSVRKGAERALEELGWEPAVCRPAAREPAEPEAQGYEHVLDPSGKLVGLWLSGAEDADAKLPVLLSLEGLPMPGRHRIVPNTHDDRGGCFVMFESARAPGETDDAFQKSQGANAAFQRGVGAIQRGDSRAALRHFDAAVEGDPYSAEAWNNRAFALANLSRNAEAVEACDRAITLRPTYADPWDIKGRCLGRLGRFSEAVPVIERFIKLAPPKYADRVAQAKRAVRSLRARGFG